MMSSERDRVRAHIEERVWAAKTEWTPFPHIIASEIFPPDIYGRILAGNPFVERQGRDWITESDSAKLKSSTPYWRRKQLALPDDFDAAAHDGDAQFWRDLHEIFWRDQWFSHLLKDKFATYFALRFGALSEASSFFEYLRTEHFLQRHEVGYFIGPHTDIPIRVATCIFSFAEDAAYENLGTQLLEPQNPAARCSGRTHHLWDGFNVVKTAPYAPNRLFLFLKTNHSFHAVAPFEEVPANGRYGMQIQVYERDQGIFTDLSGHGEQGAMFLTR